MKPDWKDAPEWATWLAMDCIGSWWWWVKEPSFDMFFGDFRDNMKRQRAGARSDEFSFFQVWNSKEPRP